MRLQNLVWIKGAKVSNHPDHDLATVSSKKNVDICTLRSESSTQQVPDECSQHLHDHALVWRKPNNAQGQMLAGPICLEPPKIHSTQNLVRPLKMWKDRF